MADGDDADDPAPTTDPDDDFVFPSIDGLASDADSQIELHPEVAFRTNVAPSLPEDATFNTFRPLLMPVACWRLDDQRFEFDSSFILPETRGDLKRLATMHDDYKDSPMCLFGHADPVGKEGYNKTLSGSRAKATYALLTRNLDMWEELFHDHSWGLSSTQKILMFLEAEELAKPTPPDAPPAPPVEVFAGPPDGKNTKEWKAAVERFQTEHQDELKVDGDGGRTPGACSIGSTWIPSAVALTRRPPRSRSSRRPSWARAPTRRGKGTIRAAASSTPCCSCPRPRSRSSRTPRTSWGATRPMPPTAAWSCTSFRRG
jgi:hypothetical protein